MTAALKPQASRTEEAAVDLRRLPITELHESPLNPRKHFDAALLQELALSLATGQLTPCLVRPRPKGAGYEIAAGHRRYRAAKIAGLSHLLCVVQPMDETRFLEVLTVENLQRDDLHPLEEAQGFAALMKSASGYDIPKIAARVGRSEKYVYDRLKLLSLTKEAQKLFLDGAFEAGHAILLARLSPADQARAIEYDGEGRNGSGVGGLFIFEEAATLFDEGKIKIDTEPRKAVSVREFDAWINRHVRFDKARSDVHELWPQTAAVVQAAVQQKEKVVSITYVYHVPEEARDEKERVYGPMSWKRADGQPFYDHNKGMIPSKRCDHAVTGVIVIGDGRGEAFKVCIAKEKCTVHWPKKKAVKSNSGSSSGKQDTWAKQELRRQQAQKAAQDKREQLMGRWKRAEPAILSAVAQRVKSLPAGAASALADLILKEVGRRGGKGGTLIARGRSAEDFVRYAAFQILASRVGNLYWAPSEFPGFAKQVLGLDVGKILDAEAPEPKAVPVPKGTKVVKVFKGAKKATKAKKT